MTDSVECGEVGWQGGGRGEGRSRFIWFDLMLQGGVSRSGGADWARQTVSLSPPPGLLQPDRDRHVTRGGSMMSSLASMLPPPCGCLTCQTVCLLPPTLATGLHHLLIRQTPADCRHAAEILQRVSPSPAGIVSNWTIKYLTRQWNLQLCNIILLSELNNPIHSS